MPVGCSMAVKAPNIVFIITDHHACHGHDRPGPFDLSMPSFERIAEGGIRLMNDRTLDVSGGCILHTWGCGQLLGP